MRGPLSLSGSRLTSGLDVLLVVTVARQFVEEEVVQALLSHVALDRDQVGLRGLDQLEDGVGGEETLLERGVDLEAGQVEVEGGALVRHDDGWRPGA